MEAPPKFPREARAERREIQTRDRSVHEVRPPTVEDASQTREKRRRKPFPIDPCSSFPSGTRHFRAGIPRARGSSDERAEYRRVARCLLVNSRQANKAGRGEARVKKRRRGSQAVRLDRAGSKLKVVQGHCAVPAPFTP